MSVNPDVIQIETKMFTPALQRAMQEAQDAGHSFHDALMAATNAHLNMLVELLGVEESKKLLDQQVEFLTAQKS